jgi:hypothetical protein
MIEYFYEQNLSKKTRDLPLLLSTPQSSLKKLGNACAYVDKQHTVSVSKQSVTNAAL